MASTTKMSPPYAPTTAGLGLTPTTGVDDPITSVFLFLFLVGAITHMTILQVNLRRGQKFVMSGMLFGFCMARITTCTMRLVWSTHLSNIRVAIAAQIFVSAGVLLLFIVNLILVQRVVRASHATWAWSKWFSILFKLYYASIVAGLIAIITTTVQSFYVLSPTIRKHDRTVQLVVSTYFAVAAFIPIPLVSLRLLHPYVPKTPVEKFGHGRFRTKIWILIVSSLLLTFGAAFRTGIAFVPRPRDHPAWYHSKAAFYLVNFTTEILVVGLYAFIRVDKRFIIPNGSHSPGDYRDQKPRTLVERINSEEMIFDEGETTLNGNGNDKVRDLEAAEVPTQKTEPERSPNGNVEATEAVEKFQNRS